MVPIELTLDLDERFKNYELPRGSFPLSVGTVSEHRKLGVPVLRLMAPAFGMKDSRTVAVIDANDDEAFENVGRYWFVGTIEHTNGVFHVFLENRK